MTETAEGRASALGEAYTKGVIADVLRYRDNVDAVKSSDVEKFVAQYASGKHYALAMVLPKEKVAESTEKPEEGK